MQIPAYLLNTHFDDRYFDVINAVEEAKQIYCQGNNVLERMAVVAAAGRPFIIGETGFGAGRNLVALMEYLDNSTLTGAELHFNSVELYPVSAGRMEEILSGFKEQVGPLIDQMVKAYGTFPLDEPGWHEVTLTRHFGIVSLRLFIGEALAMVNALDVRCDAWFLDGHAPKKNPLMWRSELCSAVGEKTKEGGTCATFTVAGHVRRSLAAAGFTVEKCPGFGVKKSVLRGYKK